MHKCLPRNANRALFHKTKDTLTSIYHSIQFHQNVSVDASRNAMKRK